MLLAARLKASETLGDRIIKVNHAGENGAVNIYRAQLFLCRWRAPRLLNELSEFKSHEERHRSIFAAELSRRRAPRCRSYHLCAIGGYALGLVTGLCGAAAVAATTVAVETVVLGHLRAQLDALESTDPAAVAAIASIVSDEQTHHDRAAVVARAGRTWTRILTPVVSAATEGVIWLGMHL